MFATVGFAVSTMLGTFLALLLERVNGRVRSASALEHALGIPVLGLMPRLPSRRARERTARYVTDKPLSEVTEAARSILTAAGLEAPGTPSGVLLVTSALPGEGKTTLSIALAAAVAAAGHKVLLVDLDLRRPKVARRLQARVRGAPRVVDCPADALPLEWPVQREPHSGIDFIDFVVDGQPPRRPLTLVQSAALRELVVAARRDYDYVILDSAPLLAVAEARIATRLVDRVVLATRWRRTDLEAVAHAARILQQVRAEIAGCVLTDVDMRKYRLYATDAGSYHGHHRGYYSN